MPRPRLASLVLLACCALLVAACGGNGNGNGPQGPTIGVKGDQKSAAKGLGFPALATKNTTRVGGGDPVADAAAVARAVYPATDRHPAAVTLVDEKDWQAGVAASVLFAGPVGAPVLFSDGKDLPAATKEALTALAPTGAKDLANAQVIRVGNTADAGQGLKTTEVAGSTPADIAARIDALSAAAQGKTSDSVLLVPSDRADLAVPAAGWAAKSGDPVLFTDRAALPAATVTALKRHAQPKIYVLGDAKAIGAPVVAQLRKLGTVRRITGASSDPVANAIAFARYLDGAFGWGVTDPGHGLVFVNAKRPADAIAAAPLSATGTYGPLLLHTGGAKLDHALESYLLDIQPGYTRDPVRGVYNHGWIIGDERAMPAAVQSRIDALLEITQVQSSPDSSS